jgi:hypothetical protein
LVGKFYIGEISFARKKSTVLAEYGVFLIHFMQQVIAFSVIVIRNRAHEE